jgi:hypothetical protein
MKIAEINEMSNEQLIAAFYWTTVRATNETNSKRGFTKKTAKEESLIQAEMVKRFDLDAKALYKFLNPETN